MSHLVSVLEFHFFHHRSYICTYVYTCVLMYFFIKSEYSNCIIFSKDFIIYLYIMILFDILIIRPKQVLLFSVFASRPTFLPTSCNFRDNTLKYTH